MARDLAGADEAADAGRLKHRPDAGRFTAAGRLLRRRPLDPGRFLGMPAGRFIIIAGSHTLSLRRLAGRLLKEAAATL